jgi:MFS family permease
MSRPHAAIELRSWALLAVPNGLIAGAVVGVIVTALYGGTAPPWALAVAVGLVTGAGPLANVSSLVWSEWSRGRDRVAALLTLKGLFAVSLIAVAAAPISTVGLGLLVGAVVTARTIWCGIITIRAVIWRANFARHARTAFVARTQVVVALISATAGAAAGFVLDREPAAFRWIYAGAAILALAGLASFSRMRIRGQRRFCETERRTASHPALRLGTIWQILREDRDYREYLVWLFVLGSGTLMATAPLILVLAQQLGVPEFTQVLITASLPLLMIPLTTPFWARLLARRHAITYRAINGYLFVIAAATALAGATTASLPLLWLAAGLQGAAAAGGMLVWALAHNDFAPAGRSTEYLGLHVTLAGIRGLLAPLVGAGLYSWLESRQPGLGSWALAAPLVLVAAGAIGFTRLRLRAAERLKV